MLTEDQLDLVRPLDIDTDPAKWSAKPRSHADIVVRNIFLVCGKRDNTWKPISFQEYLSLCDDIRAGSDHMVFIRLVGLGFLTFDGNRYVVTKSMVRQYADFVKKEVFSGQPA